MQKGLRCRDSPICNLSQNGCSIHRCALGSRPVSDGGGMSRREALDPTSQHVGRKPHCSQGRASPQGVAAADAERSARARRGGRKPPLLRPRQALTLSLKHLIALLPLQFLSLKYRPAREDFFSFERHATSLHGGEGDWKLSPLAFLSRVLSSDTSS